LASLAAIDDSSGSPADGRFPSARRAGQIEVFSDMQATGWPSKFGLDDISLVSHPIGKPAGNLAVYNARIEPARPIVGQTATLSVEVAYFDESSALPQSIPLRIEIPGYKPTTRLLRLEAGQTATVSLVFRAIEPGPLYVRFELGDASGDSLGDGPTDASTDALKEDNATGLYVQVRQSRRVGLVTGVGADNPQTASYYLARGLAPDTYGMPAPSSASAPIPDDSGKSKESADQVGGVDLTVLSPDQFARKAHPDISIFVVVEAESLSGDALARLYGYLKAGAGVIWVIDSPKALEALLRFDRLDPKQSLIPITPDAQGYWVTQADARFGSGRFESPILSVFDGPARSGLLGQRFSTVMRGKLAPMASALLRFEDGRPAMAGQWIGPGRLVVFAAPLTPSESPIIKQAPFVPLIHQLVRKLTPGPPAQRNPHPADQPSVVLPGSLSARQVRAYTIDKRSINIDTTVQDDRTVVQFDRIEKPGRYELRDSTKDQTLGGVHVEIDPRESDLRVAVGPGGKVDVAPGVGKSGSGSAFGTGAVGADVKLWPWLALTAMVLGLLEHIIATMGATTEPLFSTGPFGAMSRTNKVETS